jgi:hypothetical protein
MAMGSGGSHGAVARLVETGLAMWVGDDLHLTGYDLASELKYQEQRARASLGGKARAAKEREKRDQTNSAELGEALPSDSSASATAPATTNQREGGDSWGEAGEAERREAEVRSGRDSAPYRPPGSDPSTCPRSPDEAVRMFVARYRERVGASYRPTAADTMGMRASWPDLEPEELPERIGTYLGSESGESPSIAGFLGWYPGRAVGLNSGGAGGRP